MSAMNREMQVSCVLNINSEVNTMVGLQEDLTSNVMLKTESSFRCSSYKTHCSQTGCMQLENSFGQIHDIQTEHVVHFQQVTCSVKTECVPDQELNHIKTDHAAHIQQTNYKHENDVKLEMPLQDATCSIKSEQDSVQCTKLQDQIVIEQEEDDDCYIVKIETKWTGQQEEDDDCYIVKTEVNCPGQHATWQHDNSETFQEMSAATSKTHEVTDVMTESHQHQKHPTVTEVTIEKQLNSDERSYSLNQHMATHRYQKPHQSNVCKAAFGRPYPLKKPTH